ncbi:MAG: adenylosuccinate lyase [Deltaproteobacteria bacterium]|nr:adenylosuccinate lyase [Deltaproteobacteria bacterium]MDZ4345191.1 adenylosuccinate lyase [Candidatus Binatia bacterium]
MIPRYTRPEMGRIWSEENGFQKWLEVEILAAEGMARLGKVPKAAIARIKKKARFNVKRIRAIEREVKHEIIAFLSSVAESIGDDARYLHVGMTSSDVMDTALALQFKEASVLLVQDVRDLMKVLRRQAARYKWTVMIGRTHGVHAEPITFGLKLALWYQEMARNLARLENAVDDICVGQISGAVGTFAQISPKVEAYVCRKSGLKPAPVSNQIIQRDRHAYYFATLAVIACSLEKFAVEIRHLQRTEVQEAEEPFTAGQKGSSAMPHKRNPILSENVTGLARLMRSYALAAMENVPLWHERDISHSSVERVIAPDATIALDFMLRRMIYVLGNLCVYPENMKRNLEKSGGAVFSEKVLLALVEKGVARDTAYRMVQRHALKVGKEGGDLKRELLQDAEIRRQLTAQEIDAIWGVKHHLANVDFIFRRAFH